MSKRQFQTYKLYKFRIHPSIHPSLTHTSSCSSLSSTRRLRWKARFLESESRSSGGDSPPSSHCRSRTFSWLWVTCGQQIKERVNKLSQFLSLEILNVLFSIIPPECETRWLPSCQNPASGSSRCTLPFPRTVNEQRIESCERMWKSSKKYMKR